MCERERERERERKPCFRAQGQVFKVWSLGLNVEGFGLRVEGLGLRGVEGLGLSPFPSGPHHARHFPSSLLLSSLESGDTKVYES